MKRMHCLSGPASHLLFLNFCGTFGTTGKLVENLDGAIPREYDFIRLGRIQTNNHTCVCAKSLQLCLILCDPMDSNPPGSSVHGILQTIILAWVAMPSSRGSSQPRDWTPVSYVSFICKPNLNVSLVITFVAGIDNHCSNYCIWRIAFWMRCFREQYA